MAAQRFGNVRYLQPPVEEYGILAWRAHAQLFDIGYRFESGGKAFVYTTDSEHKLEQKSETERIAAFFREADLVIFDAMYSLADAISVRADWGHSSNVVGVELCQMARAKHLVLFHHEPANSDSAIDGLLRDARRLEELTRDNFPPPRKLEISAAHDGLVIEV